jgi:hypothetical protein
MPVDIVVVRVIERIRNSATGPWLLAGLIITNSAAAIPFGISDSTPGVGPNTFEWAASLAFAISVAMFFVSVWYKPFRSNAAVLSGALWFGTAVGSLVSYPGDLDFKTVTAFFLLPLGLSFVSFGLARVAQVERLGEEESMVASA